jgi:GT2 family glycosyltransferase
MTSDSRLVDIYMASLWRQGHMVITIKSLLQNPEFGTATISCNNYTNEQWELVNKELNDSRITLHRTNNEKGSNEKLKFIGVGNNYYICLADDDLIYPPDYLNKLIAGCEKYNSHVSLHGVILNKGIINSYYHDRTVFRSLGTVDKDTEVDIVSNCGSLFKRNFYNDLDKWYDFAGSVSMDDIYVNYFAKKNKIKRVVLAHNADYLKHKVQYPEDDYVFNRYALTGNDQPQTEFINKFFKTITPKVNIIIRAFNRLEYTSLTIREIDRLAGYNNYKMIVIDNKSTDGTGQWLKSLEKEGYYKIKPIYSNENLGDFGGTKLGYENLDPDCEYTMQWDNDCPPITQHFLSKMVKIMDAFPKIGQLMLKREGVGGVIPINNKIDFEGTIFGDAPTVTCVNMQRRKIVEEINSWIVDESQYWDFNLNAEMRKRGYELKKIENIRVAHIDTYGTLENNRQIVKYPLYTKNRPTAGGKINFNTVNYND